METRRSTSVSSVSSIAAYRRIGRINGESRYIAIMTADRDRTFRDSVASEKDTVARVNGTYILLVLYYAAE